MVSIDNKLQRMGRRRFLRTLAGVGVSGAALTHLSKDVVADIDLNEEVPRLGKLRHTNHKAVMQGARPEREPVYYTISREKWAAVETAHDAASRVNKRLESNDINDGVTAGVTTVTRNQHDQKAVVVTRTVTETADGETTTPDASEDDIKRLLPDTVAGTAGDGKYQQTIEDIPIVLKTERMDQPTPADQPGQEVTGPGNYYNYRYRPACAGSVLHPENLPQSRYGASCTPAYNDDAGQYDLVTAGHVADVPDTSGDKMYQPINTDETHKIGTRVDDKTKMEHPFDDPYPSFDAGVISLDVDRKAMLAADTGDNTYWSNHYIIGVTGRDKIVDNENSNFEVHNRAPRTGPGEDDMHTGTLGDVYESADAYDVSIGETERNDSGSPHFTREYDPGLGCWEVYMTGVHYAGNGKSRATMMSAVESEFNLTV